MTVLVWPNIDIIIETLLVTTLIYCDSVSGQNIDIIIIETLLVAILIYCDSVSGQILILLLRHC